MSAGDVHTMKKGATIQLTKTLKPICFQAPLCEKMRCKISYCTLQRIGYIITSSPTATAVSQDAKLERWEGIPIGMDTSANLPFCNAGPTSGTKLPSRTPRTMASRIQRARKRSSQQRDLKAEAFFAGRGPCAPCFSAPLDDRGLGESVAVFAGRTAGSSMG